MISLVQQLEKANFTGKGNTPPKVNKRLTAWPERAKKGWEMHTQKAVEAYRTAMLGKGWMSSWQIESTLGYARTSSTPFLKKLRLDLRLIERRTKDDLPYSRKTGYEFRWIGD